MRSKRRTQPYNSRSRIYRPQRPASKDRSTTSRRPSRTMAPRRRWLERGLVRRTRCNSAERSGPPLRARRSTSNSFFPFPRRPGWATQRPAGFTVVQPQNLQPMTVQVNPEMWLARGDGPTPVTFTITRDGMKLVGNGTAFSQGDPPVSFDLSGAVLSNNFFLLKLRVPATGNCAVNGVMILQGVGSLNPVTRTGMTFTGSALEA